MEESKASQEVLHNTSKASLKLQYQPFASTYDELSIYQSLLAETEQVQVLRQRRSRRVGWCWGMYLSQASKSRPKLVFALVLLLAIALIALVVPLAVVFGHRDRRTALSAEEAWDIDHITNLVTFGDSYTDESRGLYFQGHAGQAPPPGWIAPVTTQTAVGGYVWPRWLSWYTGVKLYNYAVGGAVCSTAILEKDPGTIGIQEYEVGAHEADLKAEPTFRTDSSVYAIWIGTNDLGRHGFIDDMQAPGKTLTDYVEAIFTQFDSLYKLGARRFVLMNNIPLYLVGMYALIGQGGYPAGHDQYWPDKPNNVTAINARMKELVTNSNYAFRYKLPYEIGVANRYPGAHAALFDTHQLFLDVYNNPQSYLNGSAPLNVTGSCLTFPANQPPARCSSPDSFIWYDELHPSEQSSRLVAKEFANVMSGKSKYATYWP